MNKSKIKRLFADLCCSSCKSDFDEDSIKIMREEDCLYVVQIVCKKCKKSFGLAFLGLESIMLKPEDVKDEALTLKIEDGLPAIGYDDVIEAHKFIKDLDKDWQKHIPEDFKG